MMLLSWTLRRPSKINSICSQPSFRVIPVRMVEGHQCHRVAHAHRKLLVGKKFKAESPNGRFTQGAESIHEKVLTHIEVHGKNLFYFFGREDPAVVHIHFGMSGHFRTHALPGPEPRETTRLQLTNENMGVIAMLSAMTVAHGGLDFYKAKSSKLGPDPLREDADKESLWSKIQTTKRPVGQVLMDQACVAGIGNIYRAEILFKSGIHPEQPANTVPRPSFELIWMHSVLLLQRGFGTGSIITVDPWEAKQLGRPWLRRYVYNHKSCGRCGSAIRVWDMANRTVYACETCQPLDPSTDLAEARVKALKESEVAKEFVSHCAREDPGDMSVHKMTVQQLKEQLVELNQSTQGRKEELIQRLEQARKGMAQQIETEAQEPLQDDADDSEPQKSEELKTASSPQDENEEGKDSIDWSKKRVVDIRNELRKFGLTVSGRKVDLIARLTSHLERNGTQQDEGSQDSSTPIETEEPEDHNMAVAIRQAGVSAVEPLDLEAKADEFAPLSIIQLRQECHVLGLKTRGRKQELIDRLVEHYRETQCAISERRTTGELQGKAERAQQESPASRDVNETEFGNMAVDDLKDLLDEVGLPNTGSKKELVSRLSAYAAVSSPPKRAKVNGAGMEEAIAVQPGINHIRHVASAEEAALEKERAGESRAVEHVALVTDKTTAPSTARIRKRKATD